MTLQISTNLKNHLLDSIESFPSAAPVIKLWSGAAPANCEATDSGTELASLTLPTDFLTTASSGEVTENNWSDIEVSTAGTVGHFRIYDGSNCFLQGTVTATGGGGDMTVSNTTLVVGQSLNVSTFTLNWGA